MLVYDGECDFCCRCAAWLRRRADVPMSSGTDEDLRALGLSVEEAKSAGADLVGENDLIADIEKGKVYQKSIEWRFESVSYTHLTLPTNREV